MQFFLILQCPECYTKIAYEWYCSKNNISGYYNEFEDIVKFITTGTGANPVSIIQEMEIYKMIDAEVNLGEPCSFGA